MLAKIFIVMGVAGSGKTTIGELLAARLHCEFADADQFHSPENKRKMAAGVPLTDEDRVPWLLSMQTAIREWDQSGVCHVLACSALKAGYRNTLADGLDSVRFIYLRASQELITSRLAARQHHYMKVNMVQSQFETLEEPTETEAIIVGAHLDPKEIVLTIIRSASPSVLPSD